MDQNKKPKMKDFFRKEGFYLALFVCLCVVATAAAFAIRNNNNEKEANNKENEFTLNIEEKTDSNASEVQKQNAERVEADDQLAQEQDSQEVATDEQEIAQAEEEEIAEEDLSMVSNTNTEVTFSLPLEGTIARDFGSMVRIQENQDGAVDQTRKGIDLNAAVGTVVRVAAEGRVEEVSENITDGTYIIVAHANGLKTKYCNLSEDVKVAVGDYLEQQAEIGMVGNTSEVFTSEVCGEVLNLQVEDANGVDIDPTIYFNF